MHPVRLQLLVATLNTTQISCIQDAILRLLCEQTHSTTQHNKCHHNIQYDLLRKHPCTTLASDLKLMYMQCDKCVYAAYYDYNCYCMLCCFTPYLLPCSLPVLLVLLLSLFSHAGASSYPAHFLGFQWKHINVVSTKGRNVAYP